MINVNILLEKRNFVELLYYIVYTDPLTIVFKIYWCLTYNCFLEECNILTSVLNQYMGRDCVNL